jgi:hypothetical protein
MQNPFRKAAPVSALVVVTVVLTLLMLACAGQPDGKALDDAMALIEKSNKAMTELDWGTYAALVHPENLNNFKAMLFPPIERLAAQQNADSVNLLNQVFSVEQLRSEPDDSFFVDFMTAVFQISPELEQSFKDMQNTHIGAVAENDSTIHVVFNTRMRVGTRPVNEMNVATVLRYEDGWRIRMSNKIEGIGMMLEQSLRMQQG